MGWESSARKSAGRGMINSKERRGPLDGRKYAFARGRIETANQWNCIDRQNAQAAIKTIPPYRPWNYWARKGVLLSKRKRIKYRI